MKIPKNIGIIGTGRVGTALGYALKYKGYRIIGASDRNKNKVRVFCSLLKIKYSNFTNVGVAKTSDLIFITTGDSEIKKVYDQIFPYLRKEVIIVHCSGVISNIIFKEYHKKDIKLIGLHPIQTFASAKPSLAMTKNICYAVEAKGKTQAIARKLVKDLQGIPIFINSKDKPLYHTICVFASNYLVALLSTVSDIARELKIKPKTAFTMLEPLIYNTLDNIKKAGVKKSLTGPIERGDINTIQSHLEIISKKTPALLPLYQALGLKTLNIAKTGLDKSIADSIKKLLTSYQKS